MHASALIRGIRVRRGPRVLLSLGVATSLVALTFALAPDCGLTTLGLVPLNDLGPEPYLSGHIGGLWPGGMSTRPVAHEALGVAIGSNYVLPRRADGEVDLTDGKIGMISIGMSNTSQEFDGGPMTFVARMNADLAKNPKLLIVNGAQGGQAADSWANPNGAPWDVLAARLTSAGLSALQVQVAWIKQAEKQPGVQLGDFPIHAEVLRDDLREIVRNLRQKYPNVRLAYLSSRTRAYTNDPAGLNPEPFAYESAFAVRWLLEQQLSGDPSLDSDPVSGVAPWLSWGPYLWTDGITPRSDGFQWYCSDLAADFTHPSPSGATKVTDQLIAYFKSDPTTTSWVLRGTIVGQAPMVDASADVLTGAAPLTVNFSANASDLDGTIVEHAWTFGEGGYALAPAPTKVFPVPGVYSISVVVTDNDGNAVLDTLTITVTDDTDPSVPYCYCGSNSPCGNIDSEAGCQNSSGAGAGIAGFGSASVTQDDLIFTVGPVPPNQFGIVFMGGGQTVQLFGDGHRCISNGGVGVFRYAVQSTGGGNFSRGPIVGYSQLNFPPAGRIQSGQTWYFQGWFRDPQGPCGSGFNLSHGAAVTFEP